MNNPGGINLLPWRQERRKQQQRNFAVAAGGAVAVALLAMMLVHVKISARIDYQQQRNQFLEGELAILDKKIKEIGELEKQKKNLVARMEVIQKLQTSRPGAVHFFDELAKTIPPGVQLTELTQVEQSVALSGIAESNTRVSGYMRNLELSPWFAAPGLVLVEARQAGADKRQTSRFSLKVMQTEPAALEEPGKTPKTP